MPRGRRLTLMCGALRSAVLGLFVLLVSGCNNPNDPRINPKMSYWLKQRVEAELERAGYATSLRDYSVNAYEWRHPQTRRREVLLLYEKTPGVDGPTGFVQAYDLDLSNYQGLRETITSRTGPWSMPARASSTSPASP